MERWYKNANTSWPETIPSITRVEAEKAALRLHKKFGDPYHRIKVRRCWITNDKPPFGGLHRGWRRLVHDVSHRVHRHLTGKRPHDWRHAKLEADMIAYVVEQGWLDGKLKPKEKPKADPKIVRQARVTASIARWEAKGQRAKNALKKLYRQRAYYEKLSKAA